MGLGQTQGGGQTGDEGGDRRIMGCADRSDTRTLTLTLTLAWGLIQCDNPCLPVIVTRGSLGYLYLPHTTPDFPDFFIMVISALKEPFKWMQVGRFLT